jgi:hypothetical protein
MSAGPDVQLHKYPDNSFDYLAPSGSGFLLTANAGRGGWTGNGLHALLTGPNASGDYTLTFDSSRETYTFHDAAGNGTYLQTEDRDKNSNYLRYSYTSGQVGVYQGSWTGTSVLRGSLRARAAR